jgi:ABC-type Zn uptake system ZnuABC Zn-binding protein ZnuA
MRLLCAFLPLAALAAAPSLAAEPLRVLTTSSDARAIAEAVGGKSATVEGLVRPRQDAHVLNPSGRMVEALNEADLLVLVGHGLERAWLPRIVAQANNRAITPGQPGHLDLSETMRPLEGAAHAGRVGSFHEGDNPHYLLDPMEGVRAGRAIARRLAELAPEQAETFDRNYREFARQVMSVLVGPELAATVDPDRYEALALAIEDDRLDAFLIEQGADLDLGGALARFEPYRGAPIVGDHDFWPYFARRYGLTILGSLEPEPGMPPTPRHLQALVGEMRERDARLILTTGHFDPRHAELVADRTGGVVAPMAAVPGSRAGTETYLEFVEHNARTLLDALKRAESGDQLER